MSQVGHENDCPECKAGKHVACDGVAWDFEIDSPVECECAQGGHA